MPLFGKKPDPKEQAKAWEKGLRTEVHGLERQIFHIEREENKLKEEVKKYAKQGQVDAAKNLARSLVGSRKAKARIHAAKAKVNSVKMEMKNQLAILRISNVLEKSSHVMASMNDLVNVAAVSETMRQMAREMAKAGLIEETIEDMFEDLEEDDVEAEADAEVEKALWEITKGQMGSMPEASTAAPHGAAVAEPETAVDDNMIRRLAGLSAE